MTSRASRPPRELPAGLRWKKGTALLLNLLVCFLVVVPLSAKGNFLLGARPIPKRFLEVAGMPREFPVALSAGELSPRPSLRSGIILEPESAAVLWETAADRTVPMASLTKLMTALVALETYRLDQEIVVGPIEPAGSQMGLAAGEVVTVETLLWGLLLNSGNDAASVLARAHPGGQRGFVDAMNQRAEALNLEVTHFVNPVGWHEEGHFSSARDLAFLGRYFFRHPVLREIAGTRQRVVTAVPRQDPRGERVDRWYHLHNTHPLLGKLPGVKGGKTGYTEEAGECLLTLVKRGDKSLVVVVLGSQDRGEDSQRLIEWGYSRWKW